MSPADDEHHIDKRNFKVPFVCGARNLGEALRRIAEGAAMIRTKGEAGTGMRVSIYDVTTSGYKYKMYKLVILIMTSIEFLNKELSQLKILFLFTKRIVSSPKTGKSSIMSNSCVTCVFYILPKKTLI